MRTILVVWDTLANRQVPGYLRLVSEKPLTTTTTTETTTTPKGLVGRGMVSLGPILSLIAGRKLDSIAVGADDVAMVKELSSKGVVVYVHRSRNPVDHLALERVVSREGLPRARFVGGLNVMALQTLTAAVSRMRRSILNARRDEELLLRCVRAGLAAELFLRRPLHLLSASTTMRSRFVEVLVRAQRELDRPIFLVPVFLALRQRPGHFEPTAIDAVLGSVEEPGLLRAIGRLAAAGDTARLEMSDAVDLQAFVNDNKETPDDVIAKKARWTILHHLARVERVAHGPALKSPQRMRDDVLKDPKLQDAVTALALASGEGPQKTTSTALLKRAAKLHDEIAARFDVDITRFIDRVLRAIWKRIYDAIIVDEADLERVRQAARRGPLVLVPSHRSHVDYLVMSQVMLQHGMLPPHIAAGENLSFFPLGFILRRGGAFFLRRSFKGDPLYGVVFRAYVRRLFKEGFTQEFFIEGGRSRTGKTLPPKLGLLSMLVDAWLESREDDAVFVPCHIAYEKIVEQGSYTRELGGAAKEKESAAGLVKATKVLGGRYGKVFVTFDQPISLREHMEARNVPRDADVDDERVRSAIAALGHRIVHGIDNAGLITAMSLVCATFFGFRRKGIDEERLLQGAHLLLQHLRRKPEARFEGDLSDDVLREALRKLVSDGLVHAASADERVLYRVDENGWLVLDVHKNHLLHHAVPEAIIAIALRAAGAQPGAPVELTLLQEQAKELSRALKLEFIFKPGVPFEALFEAALKNANASGFVVVEPGMVTIPDSANRLPRAAWQFAENLIRGFVDGYAVVVQHIARVDGVDEKQAITRLLEAVKAAVLAGDVTAMEAASKAIVENAVALLIERGVVVRDGKLLRVVKEKEAERAALSRLLTKASPPA
ncbi:MAG: 1-acyl-sn-glycerol-3-phosphate acyltransferase [Deltaproteobacteria bacterium]|nr:1-acyl-sn-glycerol-3-phosphate acyltransferase [Deltaproteobacteria bacterium]